MADATSDIATLVPHIAGLRLSARQARRLARDVGDPATSALLRDQAIRLDRLADELQARIEALKQAGPGGQTDRTRR